MTAYVPTRRGSDRSISDLVDVALDSLTDGDVFTWNAGKRAFVNSGNLKTGTIVASGTIVAGGTMTLTDAGTVTGAALAATLSNTEGQVTTEGMTTAALTAFTYTITNTLVATTSRVKVDCSTTGAGIPIVSSVIPGAGSFTVVIYNAHPTNALNAAVVIYFEVTKTV